MALPNVIFRKEEHRNAEVLSIYEPNTTELNTIIRGLNATYSATKKMWWIVWDKGTVNTAYRAFKDKAWVDYSALKAEKGESGKGEKEKGELGNSAISELANKPSGHTRQRFTINRQHAWTAEQKKAMWAYADKLRIRKYSESTFKTYGVYFKKFLAAHPIQPVGFQP